MFRIFPSIIVIAYPTLGCKFSTVLPKPLPPEVAKRTIFFPEKLYFSNANQKIIKYISNRLQNDSDILKLYTEKNEN